MFLPRNQPELIVDIHPQLTMPSVASADETGLPSPETMEVMEEYNLLRTNENGWIELMTGGKQLRLEVERK